MSVTHSNVDFCLNFDKIKIWHLLYFPVTVNLERSLGTHGQAGPMKVLLDTSKGKYTRRIEMASHIKNNSQNIVNVSKTLHKYKHLNL